MIDFKGGAFGQPFYEFAHCAGIVTNLDAQSMERFFQSMNYELEKRQRLFLKEKVSDIHSFEDILLLGCQRFQAVSQSYQGLPTFFIE